MLCDFNNRYQSLIAGYGLSSNGSKVFFAFTKAALPTIKYSTIMPFIFYKDLWSLGRVLYKGKLSGGITTSVRQWTVTAQRAKRRAHSVLLHALCAMQLSLPSHQLHQSIRRARVFTLAQPENRIFAHSGIFMGLRNFNQHGNAFAIR